LRDAVRDLLIEPLRYFDLIGHTVTLPRSASAFQC
jgi:hypothetical protein